MRSYERLRVKKQDRGRHCLFRHGVFLAARIPFFDGGQFDEGPIVAFYGGCQDHWRLTSDADLGRKGAPDSTAPAVVLTVLTGPGFAGDVFAKFARCLSGNLAKGQSKRAVKGVAESQCDVRDGICSVRQQHLRPLNPPLKKISLGWSSEGLLEGSTKVMLA